MNLEVLKIYTKHIPVVFWIELNGLVHIMMGYASHVALERVSITSNCKNWSIGGHLVGDQLQKRLQLHRKSAYFTAIELLIRGVVKPKRNAKLRMVSTQVGSK